MCWIPSPFWISNGKAVKLTEKNGKYTFTMPAGKVTVKASLRGGSSGIQNPSRMFPRTLTTMKRSSGRSEKGITGGIGNDLFGSNDPCTRAQARDLPVARGRLARAQDRGMPFHRCTGRQLLSRRQSLWAVENGITKRH